MLLPFVAAARVEEPWNGAHFVVLMVGGVCFEVISECKWVLESGWVAYNGSGELALARCDEQMFDNV